MKASENVVWIVIGSVITALVGLIVVSEQNRWGLTNAIEAAGGILFSGLLVLLYSRQTKILNDQGELMEHQNRMMMEGKRPQLMFEISDFQEDEDVAIFDVKNVGPGTAFDIGLEFEIRSPKANGLVSYGRVVWEEGKKPSSLGVLRATESRRMGFKINLPNPHPEEGRDSLEASKALKQFDYSELGDPVSLVKTSYSDARGENHGGSVIENIALATADIENVADLWSYGANYQGLDEIFEGPEQGNRVS